MCGIAGIYNIDKSPVDRELLVQMTKIIRHRGPDDEGYLLVETGSGRVSHCHGEDSIDFVKTRTSHVLNSEPANLGFGFRRLSIIDLSPSGHQPMSSADGSLWIVFNGEIYNYLELRQELLAIGYQFKTRSDTEVILNAYTEWGETCLQKFNGMWAFAIWDNNHRRLFCARDRFGIKPFAYYFDGKNFVFGSEIKQILLNPINRILNMPMIYRSIKLNSFLCYGDETYFENIKVLPHGHYIVIENGELRRRKYYDLDPTTFEASNLSYGEAREKYLGIFNDAVRLRMRSDVEVGSALSGGLDSSAIVCAAVNYTAQKIKTFTAFYTEDERFDERKWVQLVGERTGCELNFVSPTQDDVMADFERITFFNDYPIVGSSFFSQHYVMRLARQTNVTVLLDGQGSDEMLGGYNHAFYRYYADLLRMKRLKKFCQEYPSYIKYNQKGSVSAKLFKTFLVWWFKESKLYYQEARQMFPNPFKDQYDKADLFQNIQDYPVSRLSNFLYNQMMSTSVQTLLHFEDRNSMAHSIESRVPFLDYRLVELVFNLPSEYKIRGNLGKRIHRDALGNIVPSEIMQRKDKINFAAPGENYWLRREMRKIVDGIFHSENFLSRGIYNYKTLNRIYKKYMRGDNYYANFLWKIMALEQWFEVYKKIPEYTVTKHISG